MTNKPGLKNTSIVLLSIYALIVLCYISEGPVFAQSGIPSTAIYLADMRVVSDSLIVGNPSKITTWKGYNNQPSFFPDGKSILYTSMREKSHAITYRYDIEKRTTKRMIKVSESDYSPQVIPGGSFYSVVRVEKDSSQRLWRIPLRPAVKQSVLMESIKSVGYNMWLDRFNGAMFVIEKGGRSTLRTFSIENNKDNVICAGIGRCLLKVPQKGGLSFVEKENDSTWFVSVYDVAAKRKYHIIKTLPGSEDFAWTGWDDLVMGNGSKLYICRPPNSTEWHLFADFSKKGLKNITRIAINPASNKIAFVVSD